MSQLNLDNVIKDITQLSEFESRIWRSLKGSIMKNFLDKGNIDYFLNNSMDEIISLIKTEKVEIKKEITRMLISCYKPEEFEYNKELLEVTERYQENFVPGSNSE